MPSLVEQIVGFLLPGFARLRSDVDALQVEVRQMALNQAQFAERMTAMDDATNEIARDLQDLRDKLAAGGALSDENAALLDAKIARLKALGADPENPVPPVEG